MRRGRGQGSQPGAALQAAPSAAARRPCFVPVARTRRHSGSALAAACSAGQHKRTVTPLPPPPARQAPAREPAAWPGPMGCGAAVPCSSARHSAWSCRSPRSTAAVLAAAADPVRRKLRRGKLHRRDFNPSASARTSPRPVQCCWPTCLARSEHRAHCGRRSSTLAASPLLRHAAWRTGRAPCEATVRVPCMCRNVGHPHSPPASAGACRNALTVGDPFCLHGGLLHDNDAREPTSCSYCDCPEPGWGGVACESASQQQASLLL